MSNFVAVIGYLSKPKLSWFVHDLWNYELLVIWELIYHLIVMTLSLIKYLNLKSYFHLLMLIYARVLIFMHIIRV